MDAILQDLRFASRKLAQAPGITVIAVLTLALGIGANTATFSMVSFLLLTPLPFDEPERIVRISGAEQRTGREVGLSTPDLDDVGARVGAVEAVAGMQQRSAVLEARGEPEHVSAAAVSPELFEVLRVRPALGRAIAPGDAAPGAPPVVIIGHGYWERRFGADPAAVGSAVRLDGQPATIVGVLPRALWFPSRQVEAWVPLASGGAHATRDGRSLAAVARLAPGASLERLGGELEAVAAELRRADPATSSAFGLAASRLDDAQASKARERLLLLQGAVAFVLTIACANIANLQLARAGARRRELAVRAAVGAGRGRLVRQSLAESLLLSAAGGAAGLLVAVWLLRLLAAIGPQRIAMVNEIHVDGFALAFTVAVSAVTGLGFGVVPALRASAVDAAEALKQGAAASPAGFARDRLRGALLVAEVALSLVLLVGAGLMMRAYARLDAVEPGFAAENGLAAEVVLPEAIYPAADDVDGYYRAAIARLRALPGVEEVGAVDIMPLVGWNPTVGYEADGRPDPDAPAARADLQPVTPGYFRAIGIPLLRGRTFADAELESGADVAVVNDRFARLAWPGEEAAGRRLRLVSHSEGAGPWLTVVGVVGDVRQFGLQEEPRPEIYVASTRRTMSLVVRTEGPPEATAAAVAASLRGLDPHLPAPALRTLEAVVADSLAVKRLAAQIFATLGVVALLLAAIGIYGVISYSVARRTREIGIRIALGAEPRDVVRLVVRQSAALTAAGLCLGGVGAVGVARLLRAYLYGVSALDPAAFLGAALLLGVVALAAAWYPARAASRVDPIGALRAE